MEPAASSSSSASSPAAARRRLPEAAELKLRRKTLESVLEQCQRALELMRDDDLGITVPEEAIEVANPEEGEDGGGQAAGVGCDEEGASPPPPSDAGYETDELCDLLKSRVESPEFLEKLDSIQKSIYQHGGVDETISWDIISAADIWDDKSMNVSDDSEDGYVLVKQEDIVDGIASFMAAYLLSLKQTKDLTPNQLQQALSKTFSAKKRKSKLQKAWDGTKVIYNIASWSTTAIGCSDPHLSHSHPASTKGDVMVTPNSEGIGLRRGRGKAFCSLTYMETAIKVCERVMEVCVVCLLPTKENALPTVPKETYL